MKIPVILAAATDWRIARNGLVIDKLVIDKQAGIHIVPAAVIAIPDFGIFSTGIMVNAITHGGAWNLIAGEADE